MENTEKSGNFVCIDSFYLKWTKQHVKIHIAAFQKQTSHLLWVWLLGEDTAFLPDEQSFFKCNQSSYHSIFKSATYVFHLFAIFENGCNHNLQSKVRVWMLLQVLVIKPIYLIRQLVICIYACTSLTKAAQMGDILKSIWLSLRKSNWFMRIVGFIKVFRNTHNSGILTSGYNSGHFWLKKVDAAICWYQRVFNGLRYIVRVKLEKIYIRHKCGVLSMSA